MTAASSTAKPDVAAAELQRILGLPRRPVLDCERGPDRRWSPEAQTLIAAVTARYTRGPRLACGCRDRHIEMLSGGDLAIFTKGPPNKPPPPPLHTTLSAFARDSAFDPEIVEKVSDLRPGRSLQVPGLDRPCITAFNPIQAWMIAEIERAGGIFGYMPIGAGKTFCAFFSVLAMRATVRTAVLLAKPAQRLHYAAHYRHAREHFHVPSLVIDHANYRGSYIVPGTPVVHFMSYSKLQDKKSTTLLEDVAPDMIVADEAHCLAAVPSARRGAGSARAARFVRYLKQRNAEGTPVVVCAWSGSLVNKSILDMTHLAAFSLGVGSPFPIPPDVAAQWSDVVDPSRHPDSTSSVAKSLRKAFASSQPETTEVGNLFVDSDKEVRKGIQRWSIETFGVISARSASLSASINIFERKPPRMPEHVKQALEMVRGNVRPDGDEIVEEVRRIAIARDCAMGFYPYWVFPGDECRCGGFPPRCARCERIFDWYAKRKAFGRELREKLLNPEPHLDSPANCRNAAERALAVPPYEGNLPVWPSKHWAAWRDVKDTVKHYASYKWMDDFAAQDAANWAKEHRGVIWCTSIPFAERVAKLAGINYHGGGAGAEERILAEDGKKSIVVSIPAFGEGLDGLQYLYDEQLVAEPPASGKAWDQLLGRLGREGQQSEEINTWVYLYTTEIRDAFRKAVEFAEFDEDVAPTRSILLAAEKSPLKPLLASADIDFEL